MGTYRKAGKQEAYNGVSEYISTVATEHITMKDTVGHIKYHYPALSDADVRDVAAKAIRVERGRRLGQTQMVKLSFDLSVDDLHKLDTLRARTNSTKVAVIRELIRRAV